MCPIYEYSCGQHTHEVIRAFDRRDDPWACLTCEQPMQRLEVSRTHVPPDGVYSYAPNLGDPERFERQREAIKSGVKVIERGNTKMERAEAARRAEQDHDRARRRR
jgi:hypothetical protein